VKAKIFLFLTMFLSACSTSTIEKPNKDLEVTHTQSEVVLAKKSIAQLEEAEFKEPLNPNIKMELARYYWCRNDYGVAVESWYWVARYAQNSVVASRAESFLRTAKQEKEKLFERLECPSESR